jgi:predicted P-loop ATPase/GTPase
MRKEIFNKETNQTKFKRLQKDIKGSFKEALELTQILKDYIKEEQIKRRLTETKKDTTTFTETIKRNEEIKQNRIKKANKILNFLNKNNIKELKEIEKNLNRILKNEYVCDYIMRILTESKKIKLDVIKSNNNKIKFVVMCGYNNYDGKTYGRHPVGFVFVLNELYEITSKEYLKICFDNCCDKFHFYYPNNKKTIWDNRDFIEDSFKYSLDL